MVVTGFILAGSRKRCESNWHWQERECKSLLRIITLHGVYSNWSICRCKFARRLLIGISFSSVAGGRPRNHLKEDEPSSTGFIRNENVPFGAFIANRFGKHDA